MTWQSDHRETEYDFKLLNLIMHFYATMLDVNLTKYVHINVNFLDKEMWVCTTVCVTAACTRQTFYALMSHVRLHVQSPLTDGIKHLSVPWKLTIHSTHSHMYVTEQVDNVNHPVGVEGGQVGPPVSVNMLMICSLGVEKHFY